MIDLLSNPTATSTSSFISVPMEDILQHKQNTYKMPPERTIYETSLIYCELCDYSCEIDNKNAIISHYIAKHPSQDIVYNYLWSQQVENEKKSTTDTTSEASSSSGMKYYLIKANLKVRYKENRSEDINMMEAEEQESTSNELNLDENNIKSEVNLVINRIITSICNEIVQEIEVEQEVHEVQERDLFHNNNNNNTSIELTTQQILNDVQTQDLLQQQEQQIVDQNLYIINQQQQVPQQQQQQQQPQEECGENLFVFKCNLCDTYNTDDLTQLLEHYKILHNTELSVSDSSILLTAAIAAFQTGHTIEMTGAILNTISTMPGENGTTIINGEELPVHTTVQYKCTICYEIFYEKIFIVQHLHDMHQFDVDISYFEAIELQQQEQLQQKLYEQEQEQMQLVQQQQQLLQQQSNEQFVQQNDNDLQQMDSSSIATTTTTSSIVTTSILSTQLQQTPLQTTAPMQLIASILEDNHQQQQQQLSSTPSILNNNNKTTRYSCIYCTFGSDQIKKIGLHLKKSHSNKELTCMDNMKSIIIKVFDDIASSQQQQQQQQQTLTISPQSTIDAILNATSTSASSNNLLLMQPSSHQTTTNGGAGTRGKRNSNSTSSTSSVKWLSENSSTTTTAPNNKKQQQTEHPISNNLQQLFLDDKNQLVIDFNENDDLQCCYCEFSICGLNSMRTHIKLKHKEKQVIFRNKKNYKLYHIVNDQTPLINEQQQQSSLNKLMKKESDLNSSSQMDTSTTLSSTTPSQLQLNEETMKMYSHLNITLNCHYCWAQFQLNASKNPKENGNNKFMQHLNLHLNAPYLCGECLYPVRDYKTFLKHKEFYKHDETAAITKSTKCEMIENKVYKHLLNEKLKKQQEQLTTSGNASSASSVQLSLNDLNYKYKCSQCQKYSNDKDELIKHVLIIHLAFLAYKCEICTYYTFDEQQLRQHGQQVHKLNDCKYKLIKTEEEINLALNKANLLITQLNNSSSSTTQSTTGQQTTQNDSICDVIPKYKCCKCATNTDYNLVQPTQQSGGTTILLFSYQDALEHIIKLHLGGHVNQSSQPLAQATNKLALNQQQQQQQQQNKKVCHELELLEDTLEKLKDKNLLSQTTTITSSITPQVTATTQQHSNKRKYDQLDNTNVDLLNTTGGDGSESLDNYDFYEDDCNTEDTDELNWNIIEHHPQQSAKQTTRKFFYKTFIIYKCNLCDRKFNYFNIDHWLDCHNSENKTYNCIKCTQPTPLSTTTTAAAVTSTNKTFYNLYELFFHLKNNHKQQTSCQITCFICANEIKSSTNSLLASVLEQHLLNEHSIIDSQSELNEITLQFMQILQTLNFLQVYQYVKKSKKLMFNDYYLYLNDLKVNYKDLKSQEMIKLNDIYQQQIVDKSILSWLNIDQLVIRNFNINSYCCSICGMSKEKIINAYSSTLIASSSSPPTTTGVGLNPNSICSSLMCYDNDETVLIVTNHILQHFNEYCYRCIACKISWPDRTQLVRHSHECPNSQVVRTKTKYKLKANYRLYLQFNLLSYTNYWRNEFDRYSTLINPTTSTTNGDDEKNKKLNKLKIHLNDLFLNDKKFLLLQSSNYNLIKINLDDNGNCLMLEDDDDCFN